MRLRGGAMPRVRAAGIRAAAVPVQPSPFSDMRGKPPQPRVSGTTSRASDLAVPRAPAITWRAQCAPAWRRHFRPAHWQRRRRRRRRGGRGEEGAARVARLGGAPRAPRDLDRSAPPRPGVAGSPGRRGAETRPVSPRGADVAAARRSLSCRASRGETTPAVPGQPPRGLFLLLGGAGPAPQPAPVSLLITCPAHIAFVQVQWLCASPGPVRS